MFLRPHLRHLHAMHYPGYANLYNKNLRAMKMVVLERRALHPFHLEAIKDNGAFP